MNDTKLTIANALLILLKTQPLNKITVTQITKEANLTRQTFYRNFEDKEDLVNWYFEKLCLDSFKEMADQTTLKEALIKSLHLFKVKALSLKKPLKKMTTIL